MATSSTKYKLIVHQTDFRKRPFGQLVSAWEG